MKKPLFSNPEILDESINEIPLEFQKTEVERIKEYIEQQANNNKTRIVAYLGPYGSGKSVILNNVLKELPTEYKTVQFDIWKCPNDKNIWEIFLIDFLSEIKNQNKRRILNSFTGKKVNWCPLIVISIIFVLSSTLLWLLSDICPNNTTIQIMKYTMITLLPAVITITGINNVFPIYKTKIEHLFQYEKEIKESLKETDEPIVVIIEDIDRSSISGQQFLETLKCFLHGIKKPIIIICPQKNTSFGESSYMTSGEYETAVKALEDSIKIYDDVIYSNAASKLTNDQIRQLLDKIGCKDKRLEKTIYLLSDASSFFSIITIRSLKFLLRSTLSFVEANPSLDPAISFFFLSYKFTNGGEFGAAESLIRTLVKPGANHTIKDNNPETKLLFHLFNIGPNDYPNAKIITFKYSPYIKENYEIIPLSETNIICKLNTKYRELFYSISSR